MKGSKVPVRRTASEDYKMLAQHSSAELALLQTAFRHASRGDRQRVAACLGAMVLSAGRDTRGQSLWRSGQRSAENSGRRLSGCLHTNG